MLLDASKLAPNQVIGSYEIVTKLAEGGMGSVYKARRVSDGLLVALKVIPPATARNPVLLKRFEQEFKAASQLNHPNVVQAIEYNNTSPTPFLVMEFVDGESLGQRIERDGRIGEEESIRIIAQVCQGLHRAHKQGLIHRDVKPDNIMVTRDGVAKLTDLGLVKDVEGELNLTRTGRGLGTPHFMAPEQFRNAKNVDVRSDIYSLGATLYMMVTGSIPFDKCGPLDCWMKKIHNDFPAPRQLVPSLSERIDWAIRRAMSGDPEKRPGTCREFVEDLMGHSIRLPANPLESFQGLDNWYLVYKDENEQMHTVKGSTEAIRKALREGLLGDASNIRACRTKQGPFQPLRSYPEFRDLIIEPAPMTLNTGNASQSAAAKSAVGGKGGGATAAASVPAKPAVPQNPIRPNDPESVDFNTPGDVAGGSSAHAAIPVLRPTPPVLPTPGQRIVITPVGRAAMPNHAPGGMPPTTLLPSLGAPPIGTSGPPSGRLHIPKEAVSGRSSGSDWMTWVLVLLIAIASALAAFLWLGSPR